MKQLNARIFLILILAGFNVIQATSIIGQSEHLPIYFARIRPELSYKLPAISCLYHGSAVICKDGFCRLPEEELRTFFSLVITPRIEFASNKSTRYIKRIKGLPCKWYNLSLHFEDSVKTRKEFYRWDIEELSPQKMPLRLPEDATVVIELPPDFIQKIEHPIKTGPYAIKLPTIVLKKSITEEVLGRALADSAAHAPERNKNCTKPIQFWKQYKNVIIKKEVQ